MKASVFTSQLLVRDSLVRRCYIVALVTLLQVSAGLGKVPDGSGGRCQLGWGKYQTAVAAGASWAGESTRRQWRKVPAGLGKVPDASGGSQCGGPSCGHAAGVVREDLDSTDWYKWSASQLKPGRVLHCLTQGGIYITGVRSLSGERAGPRRLHTEL